MPQRRIRDTCDSYELRGAQVRVKRGPEVVDCDLPNCMAGHPYAPNIIAPGDTYAYINTGIRVCNLHFQPEDVVNAE